ncbi:hypothetical protein EMCRGX_G004181 [Ephydatia muelleri]
MEVTSCGELERQTPEGDTDHPLGDLCAKLRHWLGSQAPQTHLVQVQVKCCPEDPGRHGGDPSMKQNRGASPWGLSAAKSAAAVVASVQVLGAESSLPRQDRWMLQAALYPPKLCVPEASVKRLSMSVLVQEPGPSVAGGQEASPSSKASPGIW